VYVIVYILKLLQCVQFFVGVCVLVSSPSVILDLAIPRVGKVQIDIASVTKHDKLVPVASTGGDAYS